MRKYYYILSLLFVFVIPTIIAAYFVLERVRLDQLAIFVVSITLLGSVWDMWATRHGKRDPVWIWTFNHRDTLGIRFRDIPIEEYLFYLVSSVYIVFLWELIRYTIEHTNPILYAVLPFLALWSMLFIAVPYFAREKKDRMRR